MACRADLAGCAVGGKRPLEVGEEEAARKAPRTEEKKMEYIDTTVSCNPKLVRHPYTTEREWSVFMALTTFLRRKTLEETGCLGYKLLVDDMGSAMQLKEVLVSEDAKQEHLIKEHFLVWRNQRDVFTCRWNNGAVDWRREVQEPVDAKKRHLENRKLLPRGRTYALVA